MEPVSIILASAAAGGVVGKLSERIVEHLYSAFTRGHSDETLKKAAINTESFAEALFRYVDAKLAGQIELAEEQIEDRLTDPDFAATLETATRAASRTSDSERHALLARLVTERLVAQPASVESVATVTAIEVLPRLAPVHVEMLGLLTAVTTLRPEWWGDYDVASAGEHVEWIVNFLSLYDLEIAYDYQDVLHLASVGCVRIDERERLPEYSFLIENQPGDVTVPHWFAEHPVGKRLTACWVKGLGSATQLPVGLQIGWAVYQRRAEGAGEG